MFYQINDSYEYYLKNNSCCPEKCRTLKTNTLFKILKGNMFNINEPNINNCESNSKIYYGESSYIASVKWGDFIGNPNKYIDAAYKRQDNLDDYEIDKVV